MLQLFYLHIKKMKILDSLNILQQLLNHTESSSVGISDQARAGTCHYKAKTKRAKIPQNIIIISFYHHWLCLKAKLFCLEALKQILFWRKGMSTDYQFTHESSYCFHNYKTFNYEGRRMQECSEISGVCGGIPDAPQYLG